jgi:hypothetical protein
MSWIKEEENLLQIQEKFQREPMESIKCFFLFINQNKYIEQIIDETIEVHNNMISKERVLKIVEAKKSIKSDVKYAFLDSWMFLVDLEPENIQAYSQMEVSSQFITKLSFVDDIVVPLSIFIFHDLNALYFLFQEIHHVPVKSALRKNLNGIKSTKRVTYTTQFNKTRKNISIL